MQIGGTAAVDLIFVLRLVPAALLAPSPGCSQTATAASSCYSARSSRVRFSSVWPPSASSSTSIPPSSTHSRSVRRSPDPLQARTGSHDALVGTVPARAHGCEPWRARSRASRSSSDPLAGLLLGVTSTGTVFLFNVGLVLLSGLFVIRLPVSRPQRERETEASTIASEVLMGFGRSLASPLCAFSSVSSPHRRSCRRPRRVRRRRRDRPARAGRCRSRYLARLSARERSSAACLRSD